MLALVCFLVEGNVSIKCRLPYSRLLLQEEQPSESFVAV
jgi:hypothetical protein